MKKKTIIIGSLIIILLIGILFLLPKKDKITDENIKESDLVDKVNVTINGIKYVANLEDNETVKSFLNLLPSEFNMSELNGNEKYIYLDNNLPSNSVNVKHINKGDIMLYGDNCLVIFYKSFDTSYSYTKIGHIDNLDDLGSSNIVVEFK